MTWRYEAGRAPALLLSLTCLAALATLGAEASNAAARPKAASRTIGLALTSWHWALEETPNHVECPQGLQDGEDAQLKATPGATDRIRKDGGYVQSRGPNGETSQHSPEVLKDYLPFRELVTQAGPGVNLDRTEDGKSTARTCKHEKFTNADGEKVDNQTARVLGCIQGFRTGGQTAEFYSNEIATFPVNRHLIEITGVDDEMNDPAVEVNIYKGYDRLVNGAGNKFIAFLSQRIDPRYPKYTMHTTGRIVNGVLITDPIKNAVFPHSSERQYADRDMHDMILRLKLTPDGAEGLLAGYDNWMRQMELHSKRVVAELDKMSLPSLLRKYQQYADGYPDLKTGQCAFISAAYKVTAVRSLIVHPAKSDLRVAQN